MTRRTSSYLIVGGTSGIGQSLVEQLSTDGRVDVWSRGRPETPVQGVEYHRWDATQDQEIPATPERLDGLAYCPGSIRLKPLARLSDTDFSADFELNCLGAVRAIRASLPALRRSPKASIVLFSTVAVTQGMPLHASVAAAKGAVEGLTRAIAAELAPKIRVNAIAPSLVDTPLSANLLADQRRRDAAAERHPLREVGNASDVGALAADLMREKTGWMTGQILHLDGGMSSVRLFS